MTRNEDDEPTVRIKRTSISDVPKARRTAIPAFPTPDNTVNAAVQLDRDWRNEIATAQRDIEELRAQVRALLEENKALRDTLGKVRGR